jgi:uncharacterized membrane protein
MKQKSKEAQDRIAAHKLSNDLVARHIAERRAIVRSHSEKVDEASLGQRAADAVSRFGGSWGFIALFALVLVSWVLLNSFILVQKAFDPFPYILLNLFLSMLASIQAPVILMSQNRQGEKDRINAQHDYEVNLKAELEIMALHEKIDALAKAQLEQTQMLARLCGAPHKDGASQ